MYSGKANSLFIRPRFNDLGPRSKVKFTQLEKMLSFSKVYIEKPGEALTAMTEQGKKQGGKLLLSHKHACLQIMKQCSAENNYFTLI